MPGECQSPSPPPTPTPCLAPSLASKGGYAHYYSWGFWVAQGIHSKFEPQATSQTSQVTRDRQKTGKDSSFPSGPRRATSGTFRELEGDPGVTGYLDTETGTIPACIGKGDLERHKTI